MLKLLSATDSVVVNLKMMRQIGIMISPPPIPAALHNAIVELRMKDPTNSINCSGKTSLCWHYPLD